MMKQIFFLPFLDQKCQNFVFDRRDIKIKQEQKLLNTSASQKKYQK